MSKKWQKLRKKYGSRHGELGYQPYQKPITVNVDALTFDELERLKKDKKAGEKQAELNDLMFFVNAIQSEIGMGRLHFKTPIDNLFDHEKYAKSFAVHQLKGSIESNELNIDKLNDVIKTLKDAVLSPKMKEKVEKGAYDIVIKYKSGGSTKSERIHWSQYSELAALTEEKIACLKEALKFHRDVVSVYKKELQRRGNQKGELSGIIEKAKEISKEAEKCRKAVVKANQKTAKSDKAPTFETAKAFVENYERFSALERQYINTHNRIQRITDEIVNLTPFPRGLTVDELSQKTTIKNEYKRGKRRLERLATRR
jgi:hypothetical protein